MKLTGDKNQCGGCGEYFNSTVAHTKHRTGKYGVNRHCRTPEEMLAKGMLKNAKGFWITKAGREWPAQGVGKGSGPIADHEVLPY